MGTAHPAEKVWLFMACMHRPQAVIGEPMRLLSEKFGPVAYECGPFPFTYSDYYTEEMGSGLVKSYLLYRMQIERTELPAIKLFTNELEQRAASGGKRIFNFDPGYLCRDKLVLASTKDFYHRIYLAQGIYGEVTLHFRHNQYRHFSWTYQDYLLPEVQGMLERARARMVGDLRRKS